MEIPLKYKWLVPFLFLIVVFSKSCTGRHNELLASEEGYKLFNLESAGWKSMSMAHNLGGMHYKATLVPIQYYILRTEGANSPREIDSIYALHKEERIIEMEFSLGNKDDILKNKYTRRDYQSAVEYMSFHIENDFKVITESGDTISCAGVAFERNFKLAPFKRLVLHFGGIPEDDNIRLLYNDNLFGKGMLEYQFNETPLKL